MTGSNTTSRPGPLDAETQAILQQTVSLLENKKDSAVGWLGAAVAAFNAAGLATTLSYADKITHPVFVSSIFFAALMLTFSTGVAYVFAISKMTDFLTDVIIAVLHAEEDKPALAVNGESNLMDKLAEVLQPTVLLAMLVSLCTLAGVVAFAFNISITDSDNDRRCLAIQRDMLSSTPVRADGPELFQALGCRPEGQGSVYAIPRR